MTGITAIMAGNGGSAPVVAISNASDTVFGFSPNTTIASYSLTSAGAVVLENSGFFENWITPQIGMSGYEVRATLNSGSITSGSLGTWDSLAFTRSWQISRSVSGVQSANLTIEIRPTGGSVVDSATVTLSVSVDV